MLKNLSVNKRIAIIIILLLLFMCVVIAVFAGKGSKEVEEPGTNIGAEQDPARKDDTDEEKENNGSGLEVVEKNDEATESSIDVSGNWEEDMASGNRGGGSVTADDGSQNSRNYTGDGSQNDSNQMNDSNQGDVNIGDIDQVDNDLSREGILVDSKTWGPIF